MPNPPVLWRSPRLTHPLPQEEIEIPAPPARPSSPSPLLPMIMSAGLMAMVMLGIGLSTGRMSMMMFSVPMILASSLAAIGANQYQKHEYKKQLQARDDGYKGLLLSYEEQLQDLTERQYNLLHKKDPSPQKCIKWIERREKIHRNIWIRKPDDADFLEIRLGLGERPSTVSVVPPRIDNPISPDPLIQQAHELTQQFKFVKNAPISLPIREAGVIGIVSQEKNAAPDSVRATLIQIATHHGPDNVKIVAIFDNKEPEKSNWEWLRWLPHTWNDEFTFRYLANNKKSVHRLLLRLNDELNQRQNRKDAHPPQDTADKNNDFSSYYVCIIASSRLTEDEPVIQRLQTEGPTFGFYPIFLTANEKRLPQYCQAIVNITSKGSVLTFLEPFTTHYSFTPDVCSLNDANHFSRTMAPLRLKNNATLRLPDTVSLLEMLKAENVNKIQVYKQWQEKIKENNGVLKSIAAPIGWGLGNEELILDLHEKAHGPNGLIAGMVGAGKSILLQTLVASLAVNYHPHQVSFVLIDYKGGGMADPFKGLPHTLGVLDNLQKGNLAQRALNSFETETKRRLAAFKKAGVNHIDQYHKIFYRQNTNDKKDLPPIPYLVIIVDEFAEMKTERPEEAKGFIRIARLGRALGYRMILAMQKPEGIVDGQIEANTRFRLCLRVAQPSDSKAMLKRPDAAFLSHSGRAYFQVGVNEIFEQFQVAYGEQPYDPNGIMSNDPNEILYVELDGRRISLFSPRDEQEKETLSAESQKTQLSALIERIEDESRKHNIERGEPLWLPVLPPKIILSDLLSSQEQWDGTGWHTIQQTPKPIVGKIDHPDKKKQPPLQLDFEAGNYLIFGASGTGKTTFLKTLITSLALSYNPADVNIYVLDFGGQGLSIFDPYPTENGDRAPSFPHIGDVVLPDEPERVIRLLNMLQKEINERSRLFSTANVDSLFSYRQKTRQQLPALITIIDNYAKFATLFDEQQALLKDIIRSGTSKGIFVVIATNNVSDIHIKIRELFEQIITFNLTKNDYSDALGERPTIPLDAIPGRGFIKHKPPLELQVALPENGENDIERNRLLNKRIQEMSEKWQGIKAKPIPVLEDVVSLKKFISDTRLDDKQCLQSPMGINVANLDAFILNLQQNRICLIAGTARSGKTSLLTSISIAFSFLHTLDALTLFIFDSRKQELLPLSDLPHVVWRGGYSYHQNSSQLLMEKIEQIKLQRQNRLAKWRENRRKSVKESKPEFSPILIIADNIFDSIYDGTSAQDKEQLSQLARIGHELNISLIISGNIMDITGIYNNNLLNILKRGQRIILGSNDEGTFSKLGINIRLSKTDRDTPLTTGEGFWISDGEYQKIKFAVPGQNSTDTNDMIEEIKKKYPIATTDTITT